MNTPDPIRATVFKANSVRTESPLWAYNICFWSAPMRHVIWMCSRHESSLFCPKLPRSEIVDVELGVRIFFVYLTRNFGLITRVSLLDRWFS